MAEGPRPGGGAPGAERPVPASLRLGVSLLVAGGALALYLGAFLGPTGLGLVALFLALSAGAPRLARALPGAARLGRVLVPLAAVGATVDAVYLADTVVDALVRLLLFVLVYRLFALRVVRETRVVVYLAFFMLVAASVSAFGVGYLFVLVGFVGVGTWVLLLQHALLEAEPAPGRQMTGPSLAVSAPGRLVMLAAGATAGIVALAAGLFVILPRIGLAALPVRTAEGPRVSGFSDRVELGAYGPILLDETVVMRVTLPGEVDPERLPALRWRGLALDEFDGRAWRVRQPRRARALRVPPGGLLLSLPGGRGPVVHQEVFLEPIGSDVLFAAPRVLHVGVRSDVVTLDDTGTLTVLRPQARLAYTVESELETEGAGLGGGALDAEARARYRQLPPMAARIGALARRVAAGSADPREAALRLTAFLSREYRYTLDLRRVSALDPVEDFLFVSRAGHCEYFAAALAVMLRSLDMPTRVVNGFQRGEWNPYGRYFMVRLRDAHSWVEAYADGVGWMTLDPSPRADAERLATPSLAALLLDAVRLRWQRYVIQWSLRDQLQVAGEVQRRASDWSAWLRETTRPAEVPRRAGVAVAAAVAVVGGLLALGLARRRTGAAPASPAPARRPPPFYRRALRAVQRAGLRPAPGETAREFCERVARRLPDGAGFRDLTRAYERCRFGERRPGPSEVADIERALAALDAMIRPVRQPGRAGGGDR